MYTNNKVEKTFFLMLSESNNKVGLLNKHAPFTNLEEFYFSRDLSKSIPVGTRKIANYACIG